MKPKYYWFYYKYPQCKQGTTGSNPQNEGLQSKEIGYQQRKMTLM